MTEQSSLTEKFHASRANFKNTLKAQLENGHNAQDILHIAAALRNAKMLPTPQIFSLVESSLPDEFKKDFTNGLASVVENRFALKPEETSRELSTVTLEELLRGLAEASFGNSDILDVARGFQTLYDSMDADGYNATAREVTILNPLSDTVKEILADARVSDLKRPGRELETKWTDWLNGLPTVE